MSRMRIAIPEWLSYGAVALWPSRTYDSDLRGEAFRADAELPPEAAEDERRGEPTQSPRIGVRGCARV